MRIDMRISDDEWKDYEKLVELSDKTPSAYFKEIGKCGVIYSPDYTAIREHTEEIKKCREYITSLLYTIQDTDEAYNTDIENILLVLNKLLNSEKNLLTAMARERKQTSEEMKKIIENKIDEIAAKRLEVGSDDM